MGHRILSAARTAARLGLTAAFAIASPCHAWDGAVSGRVSGIDVTGAQNFGFRVYVEGVTSMCGTSEAWAYVNKDFDNYETVVSTITSAYLSGKTVTIYSSKAGSYCTIGYIALR